MLGARRFRRVRPVKRVDHGLHEREEEEQGHREHARAGAGSHVSRQLGRHVFVAATRRGFQVRF